MLSFFCFSSDFPVQVVIMENKNGGKMKRTALLIVILLFSTLVTGSAMEVRVKNMPPSVISTSPVSGDVTVAPDTVEIRVKFSKQMMTEEMYSFVMVSKESFPETSGKPSWSSDGRTCTLPVKLKPGKAYAIWINSGKHNAFRDTSGNPAIPYLLVFETGKK